MLRNVSGFKKEGSKQNILVSDLRKMFARQISEVQLHRRRLQSKARKTCQLVHNVKSVTTSTFESKFVLRIVFIERLDARYPVLV